MGKSIKAVVAGMIASLTFAIPLGFMTGRVYGADRLSFSFFLTIIVGNLIASSMGGWVTARYAPSSPLAHALVFGVIDGSLSMGPAFPSSVQQLQFLGAVVLALFGGWLGSPKPSVGSDTTP